MVVLQNNKHRLSTDHQHCPCGSATEQQTQTLNRSPALSLWQCYRTTNTGSQQITSTVLVVVLQNNKHRLSTDHQHCPCGSATEQQTQALNRSPALSLWQCYRTTNTGSQQITSTVLVVVLQNNKHRLSTDHQHCPCGSATEQQTQALNRSPALSLW